MHKLLISIKEVVRSLLIKSTTSDLFSAISNTDIHRIRSILDEGTEINVINEEGITPFMYAVLTKRLDIVELLIQYGADIDTCNNEGYTSLFYSTTSNELLRLLLESGADVNKTTSEGYTLLMLIIVAENIEAIELLIEYNADTSIKNNNNKTALDIALLYGNEHVIQLLRDPQAIQLRKKLTNNSFSTVLDNSSIF